MKRYLRLTGALAFSFGMSGCSFFGDIPDQFRIDQGIDPRYQDEDIRFRTTYYFRVWDSCEDTSKSDPSHSVGQVFTRKPSGPYELRSDSLYRLKMTGKANAFFNKVYFESGTLRAEEVDPFGSTVRHNEKTGTYEFLSARRIRDESELDAKRQEIEKLLEIRGRLKEVSGGESKLDNVILDKLEALGNPRQIRVYSLELVALDYLSRAQQAKQGADNAAGKVIPEFKVEDSPKEGRSDIQPLEIEKTREDASKRLILAEKVAREVVAQIENVVAAIREKARQLKKDGTNKEQLEEVNAQLDRALTFEKTARDISQQIHDLQRLANLERSTQEKIAPVDANTTCSNGKRARRGFQILGPEGFRTFDPDERLLMAFSYDAKPLISTLQELSSLKFSVRVDTKPLQQLANERVKFREALRELDKIKIELGSGDPTNSKLSASEIAKRIEERFSVTYEGKIP